MTSNSADAVGRITLDASQVTSGASAGKAAFDSLTDAVRNNWWGIKNVGEAFAATAAIILATAGSVTKSAAQFQQSMAGVARTTFDSTKSLADNQTAANTLAKQLRELALIKPISLSAISDIAEQAGALGIASQDIAKFTGVIADLVATTDLTVDGAVKLARFASVLSVPVSQFSNLGSAVFEVGRSMGATETEIVNMSTQLSAFGKQAGLTADQVVAISGVVLSLGVNSGTAVTALQRTFQGMANAVLKGGAALNNFSVLAGVSKDAFANLVKTDAASAITLVAEGIAKFGTNSVTTTKALNDIGVVEQRQIRVLAALADGTESNSNKNLSLRNALQLANKAYQDNSILQDAANRQYQTTANQVQLAKNAINDLKVEIGNGFLPVMSHTVNAVATFALGLENINGPARTALESLGGLVGTVGALGGAFLLLGPRVLLAINALGKIKESFLAASNSARALAIGAANFNSAGAGSVLLAARYGLMSEAARAAVVSQLQLSQAVQLETATVEANATATGLAARQEELLAAASEASAEAAALQAKAEASLARATAATAEGNNRSAAANTRVAAGYEAKATAAQAAAAADLEAAAAMDAEIVAAQIAANEEIRLAEAEIAQASAATGASIAAFGLATALRFLFGWMGLVIAAGFALYKVITSIGAAHRDAATAANALAKANLDLQQAAVNDQKNGTDTVNSLLQQKLATAGLIGEMQRLGLTSKQVADVIQGTSGDQGRIDFLNKLVPAMANGDKSAIALNNTVSDLQQNVQQSALAAGLNATALTEMGTAADTTGGSMEALGAKAKKTVDAIDTMNKAIIGLLDAQFAQQDAQQSLITAQQAYDKALKDSADSTHLVQQAQDTYTDSLIKQQEAQQNLADAEETLGQAREKQLSDLADAQDKLATAQDSYLNGLDKIKADQDALAKLQLGPNLDEITKATNKLADANVALTDSTKQVSDAQFQVNFLMHEGASARDIKDAQDALAAANANHADSLQNVADATTALATAQAGPTAADIAKAQRELAADYRDSAAALREIRTDTQAVADLQDQVAKDTAYKKAQEAVQEAQIGVRKAADDATTAQLALNKAQDGTTAAQNLAGAQLGLEEAYYKVAQANVAVQVQIDALHGKIDGAGAQAKLLGQNLLAMAQTIKGPVSDALAAAGNFALKTAGPDLPQPSSGAGGGAGGLDPNALQNALGGASLTQPIAAQGTSAGKVWGGSFLNAVKDYFKHHLLEAILLSLGGIGAAVAAVLLGIPALIAVAIGAAVIGMILLFEKRFPALTEVIKVFLSDLLTRIELGGALIAGFFEKLPGEVSGFFVAMWKDVANFFAQLWSGAITNAESSITDIQHDFDSFVTFFSKLPGRVGGFFTSIWNGFTQGATNAGTAVTTNFNGMVTFFSGIPAQVLKYIGSSLFGSLGTGASAVATLVVKSFGTVLSFIGTLPGLISKLAVGMFDGIANAFISAIDYMIRAWNGLSFTIPGVDTHIPGIGKIGGFTLSTPDLNEIPRLALGGIITRPTLAMIGEGGSSEAVVPLPDFQKMFLASQNATLAAQAAQKALQQLTNATTNNRGGDVITYEIHSAADPIEISREIQWKDLTRKR